MAVASNAQVASNGGISVGQGANVAITTSDPETVKAALHTVEANNMLSAAQYEASLNTVAGAQLVAANSQKSTQDAANLAIQSSQSLAAQLAGVGTLKTPESQTAIAQTIGKYASYVAIAVAVIIALVVFGRRKGTK